MGWIVSYRRLGFSSSVFLTIGPTWSRVVHFYDDTRSGEEVRNLGSGRL